MKIKLISAGVILLLILTGFGNSVYVTARCEGWERQLTAAETAAVEEDWMPCTARGTRRRIISTSCCTMKK